ncbi:MAG: hypothetical protein AAF939_12155 [Planctomycetota bacterium]
MSNDTDQISAIEASVIWKTEGKGGEDIGVHFFERRNQKSPASQTFQEPQKLSTLLPVSPLTYDGEIIKIRWCVRVRIFLEGGVQITEDCHFQLGKVVCPKELKRFSDLDESEIEKECGGVDSSGTLD